jgi:hypothetical protein
MPLSGWLDKALAGGHIRTETYEKISRKNAEALLGM